MTLGSAMRRLTLGASAALVLSACGGLLEIDDLEFTANGGSAGAAGSSGGDAGGGTAGNPSGGNASGGNAGSSAAGVGGSAGSGGTPSGGNAGASGSGGSAGNTTGGTGGCGLGSEYDDPTALNCFQQQLAGGSVAVMGGELRVTPAVQPWFGDEEGAFFYQQVGSASFAAVSRLRVESRTGAPAVPQDLWAGGGIVLRASSGGANVLASLSTFGATDSGLREFGALPQYTLPGQTMSTNIPHPRGTLLAGYIAMCRNASTVYVATRLESESAYVSLATISQPPGPDPSTLTELGSAAHIYASQAPDTLVAIDYLRVNLRPIADFTECSSALSLLDD